MISVKNVTKLYKNKDSANVLALSNLSLEISKGEFVSIVGRSGSGKSTLLNVIGILDRVDSGIVNIEGVNIATLSEDEKATFRNKNIGFIFQSYYLDPYFTVFDNVALPLIIAGINKENRKAKVEEALESLGILSHALKYPKELSGGEMQRVAMARAIVSNPNIILADEPCGNLDSQNSKIVLDLLQNISKKGKTVIMVTHNLEDAKLANRIITIEDGKVLLDSGDSKWSLLK